MFSFLIKLPRKTKQLVLIIYDFVAIIPCLFLSFYIRLGEWFYPYGNNELLIFLFASPLLGVTVFILFGFYRNIIRYMSFQTLWVIAQGTLMYSVLWGLLSYMFNIDEIPRSVIIINWFLIFILISGSRFFARWILLEASSNKVIIYGAGEAGRQLSTALKSSKEYTPIGFLDDDKEIQHHSINGLKVYSRGQLDYLIEKKNISQVLLAMPSLNRKNLKDIINYLEPYPIHVRSIPSISDISQGKIKVNNLQEVNLSDLLGRDIAKPNENLLKINITGKVVLVTGAGGSIGSELCRQILYLNPKKIILYENSELALYQIEKELIKSNHGGIEIEPKLGSVLDGKRLSKIFQFYSVQTIYHAAAYKHVPLVEFNPSQGILNNIFGTLRAVEASIKHNVETFVLISSDKAVRPTNIMGVTKRVSEMILQAYSKEIHNTCLTMVRFGNVLDSSGSVIPLFKAQIEQGGPITVTHADIVRYFMTIPEAVELVIQSGAMAKGGEVYVLDMGEPMKIYDLAVKIIKLSGLEVRDRENPDGDIEISFTGLRPGEKLFEELLLDGKFENTNNKLIMRAEEKMLVLTKLYPKLLKIENAANKAEADTLYYLLKELVPEFNPKKIM